MDPEATRVVLFAYLPALRATVGDHSIVEAVESAIQHLAEVERLRGENERLQAKVEKLQRPRSPAYSTPKKPRRCSRDRS